MVDIILQPKVIMQTSGVSVFVGRSTDWLSPGVNATYKTKPVIVIVTDYLGYYVHLFSSV